MTESLAGRVALVTGASSGIGAATAEALARRGCSLVLAARRLDLLTALAERLGNEHAAHCMPLSMDVSGPDSVTQGVAEAQARFGRIDVLVNNAGFGRMDWLENLDPREAIEHQVAVNLVGAILVSRAVLPGMLARRSGHIINLASMASWIGLPTYTLYAATKFGLRGFNESLRREVARSGVRVSIVYPGGVRTGFGAERGSQKPRRPRTPRAFVLSPEAVGEAVARLVLRPRRNVVLPWIMVPALWANVLAPGVFDFIIQRLFRRPEGTP